MSLDFTVFRFLEDNRNDIKNKLENIIKSSLHVEMKIRLMESCFLRRRREKYHFNFENEAKNEEEEDEDVARDIETLSLILGIKSLNGNPNEQMGHGESVNRCGNG